MGGVGNNMNAHMKIEQRLPLDLAKKWNRLLASQGGDPEALALAAVVDAEGSGTTDRVSGDGVAT